MRHLRKCRTMPKMGRDELSMEKHENVRVENTPELALGFTKNRIRICHGESVVVQLE